MDNRRRRLLLLTGLLFGMVAVLMVRDLQPEASRRAVVEGWGTLPDGMILGTPRGAPPRDALAAMTKAGELPLGITGFAGVAVDGEGRVYAFHRGLEDFDGRIPPDTTTREHPIAVFGADGRFERWAGDGIEGGLRGPHFLKVDPGGRLWAVAREGHRVVRLDADLNGIDFQLGITGEPGDGERHLDGPTDVAWLSTGELVVTDGYGNNRVVKYAPDGTFLEAWGGGPDDAGTEPGQFHLPHGVVVDHEDRIYVVDRENRRVQILDASGAVLGIWDHLGTNWGIALGPDRGADGRIWLTQVDTETVIEVRIRDGQVVDQFGGLGRTPGKLDGAHQLAVDGAGAVYVADTWGQRIQKFAPGR